MFKRWLNRLLPKKKNLLWTRISKKIIAIWLQRIFKILFLLYTKWIICQREKKIRNITLKMIHYWNNLFVNQLFYHISTYEINYQKKERYSSQGGEEKWKEEQYGSKHKFKETWRSNRPFAWITNLALLSNSQPTGLARKSIFVITIDFQSFIIERT